GWVQPHIVRLHLRADALQGVDIIKLQQAGELQRSVDHRLRHVAVALRILGARDRVGQNPLGDQQRNKSNAGNANSDHRLKPFRCPISSTYHDPPAARDLRKRKWLASAELRRSLVELEPECRLILAFSPTRVILRTHGPARYSDEFRRQTG